MTKINDLYKEHDKQPVGLPQCPCCGANPAAFKFSYDFAEGPVQHLIACTTGSAVIEALASDCEDMVCPLYLPSDESHKATLREAVAYWNKLVGAMHKVRSAYERT